MHHYTGINNSHLFLHIKLLNENETLNPNLIFNVFLIYKQEVLNYLKHICTPR